jgi:hypothetical protein
MKTIAAAVLAVALTPSLVLADTVGYLTEVPPPVVSRDVSRGSALKKHGIAASVLGILQLTVGAAAGLGAILPATLHPCQGPRAFCGGGDIGAFAAGATFTALGAITTSAGIPMWIYGAREEREAKLKLSASATGLKLTF